MDPADRSPRQGAPPTGGQGQGQQQLTQQSQGQTQQDISVQSLPQLQGHTPVARQSAAPVGGQVQGQQQGQGQQHRYVQSPAQLLQIAVAVQQARQRAAPMGGQVQGQQQVQQPPLVQSPAQWLQNTLAVRQQAAPVGGQGQGQQQVQQPPLVQPPAQFLGHTPIARQGVPPTGGQEQLQQQWLQSPLFQQSPAQTLGHTLVAPPGSERRQRASIDMDPSQPEYVEFLNTVIQQQRQNHETLSNLLLGQRQTDAAISTWLHDRMQFPQASGQQSVQTARNIQLELTQLTTHLQREQQRRLRSMVGEAGDIEGQAANAPNVLSGNLTQFDRSGPTAALPSGSSAGSNAKDPVDSEHITCVVCMEQHPVANAMQLGCKRPWDSKFHAYCRDCLTRLLELAAQGKTPWPPSCCGVNIQYSRAHHLLSNDLLARLHRKSTELQTPNPTFCSNRSCAQFIMSNHTHKETGVATCDKCSARTCTACKAPSHEGPCTEDKPDQQLLDMAKDQKWQRCYHCRNMVELTVGCYHIRCRCGKQFCYLCAKPWKTCECPKFDMENRYMNMNQLYMRRRRRRRAPDFLADHADEDRDRVLNFLADDADDDADEVRDRVQNFFANEADEVRRSLRRAADRATVDRANVEYRRITTTQPEVGNRPNLAFEYEDNDDDDLYSRQIGQRRHRQQHDGRFHQYVLPTGTNAPSFQAPPGTTDAQYDIFGEDSGIRRPGNVRRQMGESNELVAPEALHYRPIAMGVANHLSGQPAAVQNPVGGNNRSNPGHGHGDEVPEVPEVPRQNSTHGDKMALDADPAAGASRQNPIMLD